MINISITSDEILKIPSDKPELMFSSDSIESKQLYRQLVSKWHPDQNPMVDEGVMSHINVLYSLAEFRYKTNTWVNHNEVIFKCLDDKIFKFKYKSTKQFELGDIYIGDNFIVYSLYKDNEDLYRNAKEIINGFCFADDKMKSVMLPLLPRKIHTELITEDRLIMLIEKNPNQFLLSDVLEHYDNKIDPKHVAWMVTRFYNLACYLKWARLVHCGLTVDSCLISPKDHTITLVGGWWYTSRI